MTVRPREERTYKGVLYASKLEARRAVYLDTLIELGEVREWSRQPIFILGTDPVTKYRADFHIVWKNGNVTFEDVKPWSRKRKAPFITAAFKRTIRLWKRYGPYNLRIVCYHDGGWHCEEIIPGGKATLTMETDDGKGQARDA